MPIAKKTDKTPQTKTATKKRTAASKAVSLENKTPKVEGNDPSPHVCACSNVGATHHCRKKMGYVLFFLLLLLNLAVALIALCKVTELQKWIKMGSGGEDNLKMLERIYDTEQYQDYFRGEIDTLQTKIKIQNPTQD